MPRRRTREHRDLANDNATSIFHSLGIDAHTEYQTNTGRPIMINRDGKVIRACSLSRTGSFH